VRSLTDTPASSRGTSALADVQAQSLSDSLREAVDRHGERLVMLCSFQKEESVLVDELVRVTGARPLPVRIVTIDTGVLFPSTLDTWRAFEEQFGIAVEVHDASNPGSPWTGPEHCCSAAKVAALERALRGAEGWITGLRREQSPTRAQIALSERDEARDLVKYNPLAHWSERDIWRRIHERGLPYHPLHDQGYASIGCAPCTQPGSGREGRWAGTEKTECGLHPDGASAAATAELSAQESSP
jgi:phosphoadenosine phosphosulfate reductase